MALDSKTLKELKAKLLQEQKEIETELGKIPEVPEFGSDTEGEIFEEEADEAEEYSKNLGLKETLKTRLLDIKNALDKMAKGTYGRCEIGGEEIEQAILKVDPESRYCKAHKK